MDDIKEGQTATHKDGRKIVYRGGQWVNAGGAAAIRRDKTTPQDRIALNAASAKAQAERDAMQDYDATERAVSKMGTGPARAAWLDAITPSENGGFWDTAGSILGAMGPIWLEEQETMDARDLLNTVAARSVTRGQTLPPGPASDKDVALARTAAVNPYKGVTENLRIIKSARRDSELEQTRALVKAKWIGRYGSLATPSSNGTTLEQTLGAAERDLLQNHYSGKRPAPRKAPPSTRRPANDGWTIKEVK